MQSYSPYVFLSRPTSLSIGCYFPKLVISKSYFSVLLTYFSGRCFHCILPEKAKKPRDVVKGGRTKGAKVAFQISVKRFVCSCQMKSLTLRCLSN